MNSELNEENQQLLRRNVDKFGVERSAKALLYSHLSQAQDSYNVSNLIDSIEIDAKSGVMQSADYEEQYDDLAIRLDHMNYMPGEETVDEVAYSIIDAIDQMKGQTSEYDRMIVCAEALIGDRYTEKLLTDTLLKFLNCE